MHTRTHTKPESLGQAGRWQSPYHDAMMDHDKNVGTVLKALDDLGIAIIEGGWPGSNPRDEEFFKAAPKLKLKHARLVAFGSTRFAKNRVEDDTNVRLLIEAETPAISIFGIGTRLTSIAYGSIGVSSPASTRAQRSS